MSCSRTYTVSVYQTPMSIPFNLTVHTWIEISNGDHNERYDFWAYPGLKTTSLNEGYIYKNIFPNHLGTTLSPFADVDSLQARKTGTVANSVSGERGSSAHKLYDKISKNAFLYPNPNAYNMILGPNCNTYTQWLTQLVPEARLSTPWYAWGRNKKV